MRDALVSERMTRNGKTSLYGGTILLVAIVGFGMATLPRSLFAGGVGTQAPEVHGTYLSGAEGEFSLAALKGKPVLLDFWASWCGPCRAEMPIIQRLAADYAPQGLAVIGVNTSDEEEAAVAWIKARGVTFPIARDNGNSIARAFSVNSLPTLVLLTKEGKVHAVRAGVTRRAELEELIREIL